ncbi:MAG: DNA-binding protein [Chloroflexia bacterium]|nr:DNA-binding protein [Chloroflexia bacterium]
MSTSNRLILVRLNPKDDVLASIRAAVREQGIRNGIIISGVGSLNRYRVHVVNKPVLPTEDVFFEGEGPFDILTVTGMILDGRVHAHITFSNTERAMGGHLEEGCTVLTFAVIVIADTPDAEINGWDRVGSL